MSALFGVLRGRHHPSHAPGDHAEECVFHPSLVIDRVTLAHFRRSYDIRRPLVFGSQFKRTASPDSDVDLLVEFDHGHVPTLFAMVAMENELSGLLQRKVDLRTAEDLSRYFRDEVMRTAQVQYAA